MSAQDRIAQFVKEVKARDPDQPEFHQAVEEVLDTLLPLFEKEPELFKALPVICEPERVVAFRVPWINDAGVMCVNRGFRVQFNQALGPYKGGLRFHKSVNLSIIKFLGFEQIFKNALTTLPMGGGKGGSDFHPAGKSDAEIMRFCQSFMCELYRHIGQDVDVPAGDIGVGGREVGYMYGQFKRLTGTVQGVLTGKGYGWGGSLIRPEATGYGVVYITAEALDNRGDTLKGKRVLISGAGNVALFAAEKCLQLGAKVLTLSDSNGTILEPNGFTPDQLQEVMRIKNLPPDVRGRVKDYVVTSRTAKYFEKQRPWNVAEADIALPCATQNEVEEEDAKHLVERKVKVVAEGANMPSTPAAIEVYRAEMDVFLPAKAANAGGVLVSGLEMAQNSARLFWTREKVDEQLHSIMKEIYHEIRTTAAKYGKPKDLLAGANIAGFLKVVNAMRAQGQWC